MIQGSNANHTCALEGFGPAFATGGRPLAESSLLRSAGDVQTSFGFQILRKPMRQAIDTSEAPMSTIHGLTKFEIKYCGIANETPVTRIAGQISFMPLKPAKAQISQNGTISEKIGNCRPTIAPSRNGSMPVTEARPWIGVPSAPYATGAVLAISDRPEAASGEKPRPIRTEPVIATGVPNPEAPSKNAPNENAISKSCRRRSSVTPPTARFKSSNFPVATVIW